MQVVRTVLLAMNENMGLSIGQAIKSKTDQLSVHSSTISLAHSLSNAVTRYKPDVLLIISSGLTYDTSNPNDELIEDIYAIRANPAVSGVRIAAIIKRSDSDELVSSLVGLQVWDIFTPEPGGEQLNIDRVVKQLCSPPSIKNVEGVVNAKRAIQSPPVGQTSMLGEMPIASDAGSGIGSVSGGSIDGGIGDANSAEIESLKKELNEARRRESELAASIDAKAVDRTEYDELRKQVENKVKAASLTESLTNQFDQIMNNYDKQQAKLDLLSKTVKDQNRLLAENDLRGVTPSQLNEMKKENSALRQQLGQANSKIGWLQANARSQSTANPNEEDSYESSRKGSGTRAAWIAAAIVGLLIVAVTMAVMLSALPRNSSGQGSSSSASTSVSSQPSFSTLLKEGEYVKAAKQYPKRAVEAENGMLQDSDVDDKSDEANKISNYSNAEPIQLDNAYFNKEFPKVVDLWHESSDKNISDPIDERRVMISYSLMKCNKFSEAKTVAKPLNSESLEKRISVYQQFYNTNAILENKLKNGNLSRKDQQKARKQIEENKEAMDKL